jgi:hypothetical protein
VIPWILPTLWTIIVNRMMIDVHARGVPEQLLVRDLCGCPIWDFLCVPARYDGEFIGRLLGPRDFSLPLAGVTAHVRPAPRGATLSILYGFN